VRPKPPLPLQFESRNSAVRLFVCLVAWMLVVPALATPVSSAQDEMMTTLMDWAVSLSGYPAPNTPPSVDFVSQEFFVAHACGDRHCHVWGWYPNTGEHTVYVRDDMRQLLTDGSDPRSVVAASIVVHEFVHYLQAVNRGFAPYECGKALQLEREAYQVQAAYLQTYGRYFPVGVSMHGANCAGSASRGVDRVVP
jgi:hypothetical protein